MVIMVLDQTIIPNDIVLFTNPSKILGNPVYGRFGKEFPIRFDFLDTMQGGNLSLQVHPMTKYVQDTFGQHYTQDESYYLLDAAEGACVYLGVQNGIKPSDMIKDLRRAESGEIKEFPAEKYANCFPAKKHDHFLIPGGTVHCSGSNAMVLEISSNPYMFTFKLWDWGRLGLDGRPRPINVGHGAKNIQFDRDTDFAKNHLINQIVKLDSGEGWEKEKTGLHQMEFIETVRTWFTEKYPATTEGIEEGSCHVINMIEGKEALVESVNESFEPFVIHYAETMIIPASVGEYTIKPYGESVGKKCGIITASIRTKA